MNYSELHDQGYAVRVYHINNDVRSWRWREQTIDLPAGAVPEVHEQAVTLARIEDVKPWLYEDWPVPWDRT